MQLTPLPAFADNYIWLLEHQQRVLVVDPGEAQVVLDWLDGHPDMQLQAILVTHHHADHTGGLAQLVEHTGAQVYGPALEKLPVPHHPLSQGNTLPWGPLCWQVIEVPGHTLGHLAYWSEVEDETPILFCGDTLFSGGCGRLFEGTAGQMLDALDRLSQLPADTRVCCAHEYTLSNLRFARHVEPLNEPLQAYEAQCKALRDAGQPTLPARLGTELQINPFLRSRHPALRETITAHAGSVPQDDAQAFATLRKWKNEFQ